MHLTVQKREKKKEEEENDERVGKTDNSLRQTKLICSSVGVFVCLSVCLFFRSAIVFSSFCFAGPDRGLPLRRREGTKRKLRVRDQHGGVVR
jgi:hypothetical protein